MKSFVLFLTIILLTQVNTWWLKNKGCEEHDSDILYKVLSTEFKKHRHTSTEIPVLELNGNILTSGDLSLNLENNSVTLNDQDESNTLNLEEFLRKLFEILKINTGKDGRSVLSNEIKESIEEKAKRFAEENELEMPNTLDFWELLLALCGIRKAGSKENSLEAHTTEAKQLWFGFFSHHVFRHLRNKIRDGLQKEQKTCQNLKLCAQKCYLTDDGKLRSLSRISNFVFMASYKRSFGAISKTTTDNDGGNDPVSNKVNDDERTVEKDDVVAWIGSDLGGRYIRGIVEVGSDPKDQEAFNYICVRKEHLGANAKTISNIVDNFKNFAKQRLGTTQSEPIRVLADVEVEFLQAFNNGCDKNPDMAFEEKVKAYSSKNPAYADFVKRRSKTLRSSPIDVKRAYLTMTGEMYYVYENQNQCKCSKLSFYPQYTTSEISGRFLSLEKWCQSLVSKFSEEISQ